MCEVRVRGRTERIQGERVERIVWKALMGEDGGGEGHNAVVTADGPVHPKFPHRWFQSRNLPSEEDEAVQANNRETD